jgi:hypothetical protein
VQRGRKEEGEMKGKMGRSPKWGPEVKEGILKLIEEGNTQKCAFSCYEVPEQTFYSWMERDEEFAERVKSAEHKCQSALVKIIKTAAEKSWFAAAWLLERKWPNQYAQQTRISGDASAPIPIKLIFPEGGLSVKLQTD